jgi:hypothetical protein
LIREEARAISSTPEACVVSRRCTRHAYVVLPVGERVLSCCRETLELIADVLEVAGIDVAREYFFDNRQEVSERSNYGQWRGIVRARKTADSGQSECVLDGGKRQPTLVKLFSEQTVGTACNATGARSRTISCEQPADILVLVHEPGSALRIAERWPIDGYGMAVMPHAAEQCFHHRFVAEKVLPLVIGEVGRDNG